MRSIRAHFLSLYMDSFVFMQTFDYHKAQQEASMKKILVVTAVLALLGCAEKKPLTPEEQWQGYCRSVGNAVPSC